MTHTHTVTVLVNVRLDIALNLHQDLLTGAPVAVDGERRGDLNGKEVVADFLQVPHLTACLFDFLPELPQIRMHDGFGRSSRLFWLHSRGLRMFLRRQLVLRGQQGNRDSLLEGLDEAGTLGDGDGVIQFLLRVILVFRLFPLSIVLVEDVNGEMFGLTHPKRGTLLFPDVLPCFEEGALQKSPEDVFLVAPLYVFLHVSL